MNRPGLPTPLPEPWWREPMVWLVIGGPAIVVVAALTTAVVAWRGADPVVSEAAEPTAHVDPSLQPALKARNHAAKPR